MKLKDLINLIDLEIERNFLYEDFTKINCLRLIERIIKKSRTRQEFISSMVGKPYTKDVFIELLDKKINELEKRINYEKMLFDNFSDSKDITEMYEVKLNFYKMLLLDIKEVK